LLTKRVSEDGAADEMGLSKRKGRGGKVGSKNLGSGGRTGELCSNEKRSPKFTRGGEGVNLEKEESSRKRRNLTSGGERNGRY